MNRFMAIVATLLAAPCIVAPARADIMYVIVSSDNKVVTFDTAGGPEATFASTGNDPRGLAFDIAGNLFVANAGDSTITKFTTGGIGTTFATSSSGLNFPFGLAFDSTGNLYAANAFDNSILKFTPGGAVSVFANTGLNSPYALAFDASGNLYASNGGGTTIQKFTTAGVGSVFANTGGNIPSGLAFDSAGNLYVATSGPTTEILKFSASGGTGTVFSNDILLEGDLGGLAFDSAGNLYAANSSSKDIVAFTPGGTPSLFATVDGFVPTFITFQTAVPEPASIILLGFASLALAFRHRPRPDRLLAVMSRNELSSQA